MTPEEHLQKWVCGESVHNDEDDVCCPDFSCCNTNVDTSHFERKRFQKAFLEGDIKTICIMREKFLIDAIFLYGEKLNTPDVRKILGIIDIKYGESN